MVYTGLGKMFLFIWEFHRERLKERKKINITVSERTRSCSTYITISDKQLCSAVRKALEILPDASEFYNIGECCQRNIFAQC